MTIKAQIDLAWRCAMEHKSGQSGSRCKEQCAHCWRVVHGDARP